MKPARKRATVGHPFLRVFEGNETSLQIMLQLMQAEHVRTGNPLYAWAAIANARRQAQPLPDWVLRYLDRCAKRLMRISARAKDWKADTLQALEMKRAPFRAAKREAEDRLLADESRFEDMDGLKGAEVVAERRKVSRAKVYRARGRS